MHTFDDLLCPSEDRPHLFFRLFEVVEQCTVGWPPCCYQRDSDKRLARACVRLIPIESLSDPYRGTEVAPRGLISIRAKKFYSRGFLNGSSDTAGRSGNRFARRKFRPIAGRLHLALRLSQIGHRTSPTDGKSRVSGTPAKENGRIATIYATEVEHDPGFGINDRLRRQARCRPASLEQFTWHREGAGGGRIEQQGPTAKSESAGGKFSAIALEIGRGQSGVYPETGKKAGLVTGSSRASTLEKPV
jgi:hypothetical protein